LTLTSLPHTGACAANSFLSTSPGRRADSSLPATWGASVRNCSWSKCPAKKFAVIGGPPSTRTSGFGMTDALTMAAIFRGGEQTDAGRQALF
jgi:hypothetical protein